MGMKREIIRRTLLIYLDCYLSDSNQEIGKVVDISNKGMLLISNQEVERDTDWSFRINLPRIEAFPCKEMYISAQCHWIRPAEIEGFFYYGFSFSKTELNHSEIINKLIQKIGFSNGQRKISTTKSDFDFM